MYVCELSVLGKQLMMKLSLSFKTCGISTHLDSDLEITDKEDDVSDKDIDSDDN